MNVRRKKLKQTMRAERGNVYVLYLCLSALLIAGWSIFADIGISMLVSYRNKCALEAAALAAARDLSKIVIDDAKWGFVSLTDQPPIGSETVAADGYPLPVTGINTILGTVRLELLVANSIGTNEAIDCALSDLESARSASRHLSRVLGNSLKEPKAPVEIARDMFGKEILPMKSARDLYSKNAASLLNCLGWQMNTISGELGWLEGESITNTPLPGTGASACIDSRHRNLSVYPAFVDMPAFNEEFYFAGLDKQVSLVESDLFRTFSSRNNCSIIKLSSQLKRKDKDIYLKAAACAQPAYMEDKTPAAYLVLRFPNGFPSRTNSLRDLLTSEGMRKEVQLCTASGGDFPIDRGSVLRIDPEKPKSTMRYVLTRAFFDWLKTAHSKTNIDSILNALDCQFNRQHSSNNTFLFAINSQGIVSVDTPQNYPFPSQTAYENQLYMVAFDAVLDNGLAWTARVRDQVHRLGKQEGGKHAGQPMPSILAVDLTQDASFRVLERAGNRYDRSRLATEIEISSPVELTSTEGEI
ncbi:MAG: hypothetical protein K2X93_19375 [Candidatus Obscuribacterales bacterium]|nr:hypothetical protein [Candidatus Obscuribacterales bacterium]